MKYICQYCGRECATKNGLVHHEVRCEKNPNRVIKTYKCQYCGKEFKSKIGKAVHENLCEKNPNMNVIYKTQEYSLMKDEELIKIFQNKFKYIKNPTQLCKINCALLTQLKKRNLLYIVFPNKRKKAVMHPEYNDMTDVELLNIFSSEYSYVKNRSELAQINLSLCNQLAKRNLLIIIFPKNDITDTELLNIFRSEYSHVKNPSELAKINRSLCYQLSKRNLLNIIFPNRQLHISKESKLNLLTDLDLESMDWASILDLIGLGKLPKEFSKLAKFGANIPGRKQMMQDLIDTYNITQIEEAEKEITDEFESDDDEVIPDIDTEKENKRIGDTLGNYTEDLANDSKFKHLREKSVNRLWTKVLDDKNYINEIYKKIENNSLTKFEKFIYEEFLDEYNEVENMEIH